MIYKIDLHKNPEVRLIGRLKYKSGWEKSIEHSSNVILFVINGRFSIKTESFSVSVSEKNMILMPKGTNYYVRAEEECDYFYVHFSSLTKVEPADESEYTDFLSSVDFHSIEGRYLPEAPNAIYINDKIDLFDFSSNESEGYENMMYLFSKCEKYARMPGSNSKLFVNNIFTDILLNMSEFTQRIFITESNVPPALLKIVDYIKNNYTSPITLSLLSEKCGISKQYIMRLFKQHYNITVTHYINQLKLNKALDLLRFSRLNIDEIAYSLGYSGTYYFCRLFKNEFNSTPTEYRRRYMNS